MDGFTAYLHCRRESVTPWRTGPPATSGRAKLQLVQAPQRQRQVVTRRQRNSTARGRGGQVCGAARLGRQAPGQRHMHARASAPGKLEPGGTGRRGVQASSQARWGWGERRARASKPALSSAALHKELLLVCVPVTSTARRRWSEETGTLLVARRLVWPLWPACACAGTWDDETKMT
jgi:hypothetical protein